MSAETGDRLGAAASVKVATVWAPGSTSSMAGMTNPPVAASRRRCSIDSISGRTASLIRTGAATDRDRNFRERNAIARRSEENFIWALQVTLTTRPVPIRRDRRKAGDNSRGGKYPTAHIQCQELSIAACAGPITAFP